MSHLKKAVTLIRGQKDKDTWKCPGCGGENIVKDDPEPYHKCKDCGERGYEWDFYSPFSPEELKKFEEEEPYDRPKPWHGKPGNFSGQDLSGEDFAESEEFDGANLSNANLSGSNFAGAVLENAKMRGANCKNTNFEGAQMYGVNMKGADLSGANFLGADLTDAYLEGAIYDSATQWPKGFDPKEYGATARGLFEN